MNRLEAAMIWLREVTQWADGHMYVKSEAKDAKVIIDRLNALEAENAELRERIKVLEEALEAYGNHDLGCLLSQYRESRPTKGGGYETLYGYGYKAKWYRDGERPECTCGFDAALVGGKEE